MNIKPGHFYLKAGGRLVGAVEQTVADALPGARVWICRRVADFPGGKPPAGASIAACELCDAGIAYNPKRNFPDAVKRCMQCEDIEPMSMEPAS